MYVQNPYDRTWTYQPQKMSHTSLCVRIMRHFSSQVQDKASFFDVGVCMCVFPLWEHVWTHAPRVDGAGWPMLNICNLAVLTTAQTWWCPASADLLRSPTPAGSPWAASDRKDRYQPITSIQKAADKANASHHGPDRVRIGKQESLGRLLVLIPFSVAVSSACREVTLKLKEQQLEACACFLTRLSPVAV